MPIKLFTILAVGLLACSFAVPAYADAVVVATTKTSKTPDESCNKMQENVTINVSFNIKAKSFDDAKTKFDEKMKQINDFAKQQKVTKFDMQSMNYNINHIGGRRMVSEDDAAEQGYQLNGNINYQLDSSESAFKLGEFLSQQKFQVGVNVNKFRNGACNNMMNMSD